MNNIIKNTLISLTLFVVVSGTLGLQRCRTKCLEESIRCTAGSVLPGEAVNCLVVKYQCKENCYKDQIAMLKTKLLFKMMNIVEDDKDNEDVVENIENVESVESVDDDEDNKSDESVDDDNEDVEDEDDDGDNVEDGGNVRTVQNNENDENVANKFDLEMAMNEVWGDGGRIEY